MPDTCDEIVSVNENTGSPAGHASVPSGAGMRRGTVADQDTEGAATVPHPASTDTVEEHLDQQQRTRARRRLRRRIRQPAERSDVEIIAERLAQEQRDV